MSIPVVVWSHYFLSFLKFGHGAVIDLYRTFRFFPKPPAFIFENYTNGKQIYSNNDSHTEFIKAFLPKRTVGSCYAVLQKPEGKKASTNQYWPKEKNDNIDEPRKKHKSPHIISIFENYFFD